MIAFIRWIFGVALAVLVTAFAVFNRQDVEVIWSPMHESEHLPLYAVGLGMMAVGFFIGGAMVWFNQGSLRSEKRKQKKQIKHLEQELETASDLIKTGVPQSDLFPSLPRTKA